MKNNTCNTKVKMALLTFSLIATSNAEGIFGAESNLAPMVCTKYGVEPYHLNILDSLKTTNYYRAAAENKDFGGCSLYELGNGNQEFIAMRGTVTSCFPNSLKDAIKQYGEDARYYDANFSDPAKTLESLRGNVYSGPDKIVHDIERDMENFDSVLKGDKVALPQEECVNSLMEIFGYGKGIIEEVMYRNQEVVDNLVNSLDDSTDDAMYDARNGFQGGTNEDPLQTFKKEFKGGQSIKFAKYVYDQMSQHYGAQTEANALASTSNQYIEKNIGNIFPSIAKVTEATPNEVSAGGCVNGLLKKYISKNGERSAVCIGNNVNGERIADYIAKHPETKDWLLDA